MLFGNAREIDGTSDRLEALSPDVTYSRFVMIRLFCGRFSCRAEAGALRREPVFRASPLEGLEGSIPKEERPWRCFSFICSGIEGS